MSGYAFRRRTGTGAATSARLKSWGNARTNRLQLGSFIVIVAQLLPSCNLLLFLVAVFVCSWYSTAERASGNTMKVPPSLSRSATRFITQAYHSSPRPQAIRSFCRQTSAVRALRVIAPARTFCTSSRYCIALTPGSSDPEAPNTAAATDSHSGGSAAELSDGQYHEIADTYLNKLLLALEEKAEASSEIEVEYSVSLHSGWHSIL